MNANEVFLSFDPKLDPGVTNISDASPCVYKTSFTFYCGLCPPHMASESESLDVEHDQLVSVVAESSRRV